jgi:3-dehydroquinate synthase
MTDTTNPADRHAVRVDLGERSYDIRFYDGEASALARDLRPVCPDRAFVVTNETVWAAQGAPFAAALREAGVDFTVAMVGDGEKHKTLDSASALYDRLIAGHFTRRACVVAFGGGVIGDLAGFVAATFLRGVDFVQVPTTVLAMVDSSVGGKTGVDHPLGKNLIGAFYQPRLVAVDLAHLKTLDDHNVRGGFGEIIKYGVIRDAAMFAQLERGIGRAIALEQEPLLAMVRRSCEIKAQVVGEDEREGGVRAILNYGHTFAHAIESVGEYAEKQFHGQAVAIGMVAAAELACDMGIFDAASASRIRALVNKAGLPDRVPDGMPVDDIMARMKSDKKVVGSRVRFVLPVEIGRVEVRDDVEPKAVRGVLLRLGAAGG